MSKLPPILVFDLDGTIAESKSPLDAEMATLNLKGDDFHPDWNYTISPRERTEAER